MSTKQKNRFLNFKSPADGRGGEEVPRRRVRAREIFGKLFGRPRSKHVHGSPPVLGVPSPSGGGGGGGRTELRRSFSAADGLALCVPHRLVDNALPPSVRGTVRCTSYTATAYIFRRGRQKRDTTTGAALGVGYSANRRYCSH